MLSYLAEGVSVPNLKIQPRGDLTDRLVPGEHALLLRDHDLGEERRAHDDLLLRYHNLGEEKRAHDDLLMKDYNLGYV